MNYFRLIVKNKMSFSKPQPISEDVNTQIVSNNEQIEKNKREIISLQGKILELEHRNKFLNQQNNAVKYNFELHNESFSFYNHQLTKEKIINNQKDIKNIYSNGKYVVVSYFYSRCEFYDLETEKRVMFYLPLNVIDCVFSSNNIETIIILHKNIKYYSLNILNMKNNAFNNIDLLLEDAVCLNISPDNKYLIVGNDTNIMCYDYNNLIKFFIENQKVEYKIKGLNPSKFHYNIISINFLNETQFLVQYINGIIRYNLSDLNFISIFNTSDTKMQLRLISNNQKFLYVNTDSILIMRDLSQVDETKKFKFNIDIINFTISPNAKYIFLNDGKNITVYPIELLESISGIHQEIINIPNNERTLLNITSNKIILSGKYLITYKEHSNNILIWRHN